MMFTEARLRAALEMMVAGIDAPPAPVRDIRRKLAQPSVVLKRRPRYIGAAITASVLLVAGIAFSNPSFVQAIEDRYAAALRAMGSQPPPVAPNWIRAAMRQSPATLASAQSRVSFKIVAPTGLPSDTTSLHISTTPTGVYAKATRSWEIGPPTVTFSYGRRYGRSFFLIADRFDLRFGRPPKYVFEPEDDSAGQGSVVLIKHENFAWRNGNQIMTVAASSDISAAEIRKIRHAMHGRATPQGEVGDKSGAFMKIIGI